MCMICNLGPINGPKLADPALQAFERAREAMKEAKAAMLAVAKVDPRYDRTHKKMVRMCRDWSRLEHEREHDVSVVMYYGPMKPVIDPSMWPPSGVVIMEGSNMSDVMPPMSRGGLGYFDVVGKPK